MSLESNKNLGGIGAILLAIPFLSLIGIILLLIAMKGMADYYDDEEIFQNALYGFIFGFIGVIALIAVIIMFALGFGTYSPPVTVTISGFGLLVISIIILYVFSLIGAVFYKKSLDALSEKSNEQMFTTAGLILLIGAAIPLFGEILKFIAWILAAVGFFSIKKITQPPESKEAVPPTEEKRFCKYCGAQIQPNAIYCQNCGKKIE